MSPSISHGIGRRTFAAGMGLAISSPLKLARAAYHRPIKVVVPFAAGSSVDVLARLICGRLSHHLETPLVIDNRPGAGGCVAAASASRAAPDGNQLFCGTAGTHGVNPALYRNPGYDPVRDFEPVIGLASSSNVMVVNRDRGIASLGAFVARAKAQPGMLTMGSDGTGTTSHLSGVLFNREAGITTLHVPASNGTLLDIVAGRLDYGFEPLATTLPFIRTGGVFPLIVTAPTREPMLPGVPTAAESGYPGCVATAWAGFFASRGAPGDFIERVNEAANLVLMEPEMRDRIRDMGGVPLGGSATDLRKRVAIELARWPDIVRAANITIQ